MVVQQTPDAAPVDRFVDFIYQPVRDADGAVAGIFAQGHDVTEQVSATLALEEADRRKDEFLATLAHELRNPLAPIRQAALVAKASPDTPRQQWALDVIQRQVGHMALLLDDLLDVSRISRGKLELRMARVDLRSVVDAAVETAWPLLEARKHRLDMHLPPRAVELRADPRAPGAGAVQPAVERGQVHGCRRHASRWTRRSARDSWSLRVRDNGIGLSPEHLERDLRDLLAGERHALSARRAAWASAWRSAAPWCSCTAAAWRRGSEGPGRGSEFTVRLPLPASREAAPHAPAARRRARGGRGACWWRTTTRTR